MRIDWNSVEAALNAHGHAPLGPLIEDAAAAALIQAYDQDEGFRSHIQMQRHGFGQGEYKYFSDPLPEVVADLRTRLYPTLSRIANTWEARLNTGRVWPPAHGALIDACAAAGQAKPTPLLLKYQEGDYNCLHQDIYGDLTFPLQAVVLLSDPREFDGGEFVLTEQRPRMQSRAEVVPLERGHGIVFAVSERPKEGVRGPYRVKQRHGVSRLRAGRRFTLGVIFHNAA